MASSLKNISVLISPKFLSPLSPSRNLVRFPKSDGKMYFRQISRTNVAKKLYFSPGTKALNALQGSQPVYKLPQIQINSVDDETELKINHEKTSTNVNVLDINTPMKLDLAQHGLKNVKSRTTVLGKGTFGTVFKGIHKGKPVAVKIVTRQSCSRERNALNISQKNIVQTLEIIQSPAQENYSLIIMEYLPNCKSLQDVLDNFDLESSKLNAGLTLKLFATDITTGLDYLHKTGIMHMDLKPKNILVTMENHCKICDFGNSIKVGDNTDDFKHNGTVVYTAPEILLGKAPTTKSDIYSLGIIFWQIRYQKNPFQEYEIKESIIYNIGKHDIRPAYQNKNPDGLASLFTRCWASDPELRPNAEVILVELKNVEF